MERWKASESKRINSISHKHYPNQTLLKVCIFIKILNKIVFQHFWLFHLEYSTNLFVISPPPLSECLKTNILINQTVLLQQTVWLIPHLSDYWRGEINLKQIIHFVWKNSSVCNGQTWRRSWNSKQLCQHLMKMYLQSHGTHLSNRMLKKGLLHFSCLFLRLLHKVY